MKRKWNWGMWLMCGLMVACLAATGCKDDDDKDSGDDGSGEAAPGGGGGGSTAPGGGAAPGGGGADPGGGDGDAIVDRPALMVGRPTLASPANNTVYSPRPKWVVFSWNPVAGATSYLFNLNSVETEVTGTSVKGNLAVGDYTWNVKAVATRPGYIGAVSFPSATWRVTILSGAGGL